MRAPLCLVLCLFLTTNATASLIDVDNLVEPTGWASINPPVGKGQTFIPTMTGYLDSIVLELGDVGTVKRGTSLEVYAYSDNESVYLGESYLWLNPGFNLTRYSYSFSNLLLTAGEKYAFILFGEDIRIGATHLDLPYSSPLRYSEGQWVDGGGEIVFATSMSAVPEPSTIALLVVGWIWLGSSPRD